jgi:hypothetical protein
MDSNTPERITPRRYWPEDVVNQILEGVAAGDSLTAICARPRMPNRITFYQWVGRDPELKSKYVAALQAAIAVRHA